MLSESANDEQMNRVCGSVVHTHDGKRTVEVRLFIERGGTLMMSRRTSRLRTRVNHSAIRSKCQLSEKGVTGSRIGHAARTKPPKSFSSRRR
jgi:hypothetical protein